jgi:hypothetical protein
VDATAGSEADDASAREERAARLREEIERLESGDGDEEAPSPREFTDRGARDAREEAGRDE